MSQSKANNVLTDLLVTGILNKILKFDPLESTKTFKGR